jgi:hypothetical protein
VEPDTRRCDTPHAISYPVRDGQRSTAPLIN